MGDMNADFRNDLEDFDLFVTAYDGTHGAGALVSAIEAQVPEPASIALASVAGLFFVLARPRRLRPSAIQSVRVESHHIQAGSRSSKGNVL